MSWNVANRVGEAARPQGEFLARLDPRPDVILLQEANRRSVDALCDLPGWAGCTAPLTCGNPNQMTGRCAAAG